MRKLVPSKPLHQALVQAIGACFLIFCLQTPLRAQTQDKAYCDSLLIQGVESVLEKKNYSDGLLYLEEARSLAAQNQWHKQEFLALNNLGILYYSIFDYGEALNYYLEAYTLSLKHLENSETMIVLNNIAVLYSREENFEKAEDYFSQAYRIAQREEDWFKVGSYSINLGIICAKNRELDKAESYIEEALELLSRYSDTTRLLEARSAQMEIYLQKGLDKPIRQEGQELMPQLLQKGMTANYIDVALCIAESYLRTREFELARRYAQKALNSKPDLNVRSNIYRLMSEINYKTGHYNEALLYKDSILLLHDSLNIIKNGRLFESSKLKFELQHYQYELDLKEAQVANGRKLLFLLLSASVLVVAFLLWWLHMRSTKLKQEKEIESNKRRIGELELEKLQHEVELRNRQLAAKALSISSRDQLLEELLSSMTKYPGLAAEPGFTPLLQNLKKQLSSEKEWNEFVTLFEDVNHGFLSKLKQRHPDLNANDIRYLSYVYMSLSTKEIASIFNITVETCRKRKERIVKKMKLAEGVNLYDYLFSL